MSPASTQTVGPNHPQDPFLHGLYDQLHDSPMQQKFRKIHPWPVGCVFIEHPGMTLEDIRAHFKLMRELGYTALKQCQTCRGTDNAVVMHMAIDEGIIPWWYGEGGWEEPTPELLEKLGISADTPIEQLREDPKWIEHQKQVLHERVDNEKAGKSGRAMLKKAKASPRDKKSEDWVPGVQPTFEFGLTDDHVEHFVTWLKHQYETIDTLNDAWNVHHCMSPGPKQLPEMGGKKIGWDSWEHLQGEVKDVINGGFREYRRTRDLLRYMADNYIAWLRDRYDAQLESDPNAPVRAGGEMGLFLPFASRGTDMEGIAELMKDRGSFYPSFHPAWHFEEVDFEGLRPMYMQSSITTDWFKGGWNATWESTGGPQQMTGHKAPFVPEVREKKPGFTVDEATMTQLMFSWIAGGYRGFGIWAWSIRTFGWEGGEFALLDRNNRPTERAKRVGQIGQACRRLRDELWTAKKEPVVGILQDWETEAIWAATSIGGRDFFKKEPIRARIGASRAMINGNVPWEHVTATDIRNGLIDRYQAIYMPAFLALDEELLTMMRSYCERGGRVVLDAPGGWYDIKGRVLRTDDGSAFEQLFGARLGDFQYSSPQQRPYTIAGRAVDGTILDIQPTTAEVAVEYDYSGKPAVTKHRIGSGEAVILTYEASRHCTQAGNEPAEADIRSHTLAGIDLPYACDDAIVYRLATDKADHYFLLNEGQKRDVLLMTPGYEYKAATDVLTGTPVDLNAPTSIDAFSGRWIRAEK